MSDVQAAPAAVAVPASETVPTPVTETPAPAASTEVAAPHAEDPTLASHEPSGVPAAGALVAAQVAPEAAAAEAEPKPVEPVNDGILGYKAPGLLKQFTFAKKDFWFSDEPVAPANLELYLRGEKSEVSHPVVAWASQTGKGLLFFVKKGETEKTRPAGVLPLYDAVDLKKSSPTEFSFKLHNHNHSFKASTEAERDGWYHSVEKSIELGKAQKESIVDSEGYKAELQKLATPPAPTHTAGGFPIAAAGAAAPKKSTELDNTEGAKRAESDEEDLKKKTKSRSTSRGVLARLRGKKDELEAKVEEKKEEVKADKAEQSAEAPAAESTPLKETAAAVEEKKDESAGVEGTAVAAVAGAAVLAEEHQEKPKTTKRGSIFGSLKAGFKSPVKEKEQKDVELKTDAVVSDAAPQLPESTVAPAINEPVEPTVAATEPAVASEKEAEIITPVREKKNFLSGLGFAKRDRSVSPSAVRNETAAAPVAAPATTTETPVLAETSEGSVEVPAAVAPGASPLAAAAVADGTDEKADEVAPVNKRQSVFGGIGRRASKIIQRVQSSNKKETPAAEKVEESAATETAPVEHDLAAHEATEPSIENKPETVATSTPTVTATA